MRVNNLCEYVSLVLSIKSGSWGGGGKGHTFEVDEFFGDNEGLVMAEVELSSEDEEVELPDFIGKGVTGNPDYYNGYLRKNPYCNGK